MKNPSKRKKKGTRMSKAEEIKIRELFWKYTTQQGMRDDEALKKLAKEFNRSKYTIQKHILLVCSPDRKIGPYNLILNPYQKSPYKNRIPISLRLDQRIINYLRMVDYSVGSKFLEQHLREAMRKAFPDNINPSRRDD
jgi:hypothetical protein